MTVKEELEHLEHRRLNPLAAFADQSTGRPARRSGGGRCAHLLPAG